jgi:hypothetical protein
MCPKRCLDDVEKWKIFCPCRKLELGRRVRSPSLYRLSYSGTNFYNLFTNTLDDTGESQLNGQLSSVKSVSNLKSSCIKSLESIISVYISMFLETVRDNISFTYELRGEELFN